MKTNSLKLVEIKLEETSPDSILKLFLCVFSSNICRIWNRNFWPAKGHVTLTRCSYATCCGEAANRSQNPSQNIQSVHVTCLIQSVVYMSCLPFSLSVFLYSFSFLRSCLLPHTCKTFTGQDLLRGHVLFFKLMRILQGLRHQL